MLRHWDRPSRRGVRGELVSKPSELVDASASPKLNVGPKKVLPEVDVSGVVTVSGVLGAALDGVLESWEE